MRLCLATSKPFPKKEMFRIVRTPEGEVKVDCVGKMNGRGAYISKSKEAILLAKSKKVLDKKLEIEVKDEIYDELLDLLK
ncbi:MAG: YlxR family protein [Bacilli bacterium]|nr:YlxR family protein [Bacilli bacterium]